jgi:sn-glycerol 3-phosphate transport system ATP-binding protein
MSHLSVRALKKRYDAKQVLHGVDLDIEKGEFVVIVGPSGCGKSTLLRMIAGLESVTEGTIMLGSERIDDFDPADRGCAMVFQNYALYPHMTVRENIGYPLKIARLPKAEREKRVADAAAMLDLSDYLDRRPAQLSGGQRQRVAMGRALVREPGVFLFDEPLSNLDAKLRVTMRIEIKRLHRRLKATSIFVTHDQVEAMTMADKLVVMNGGFVEQIGSPVEIYRRPASTFVAGFLGAPAMNLMPASVSAGSIGLDGAPQQLIDSPAVLEDGTAAIVGIRPEDVVIAGRADTIDGARVDLIEELGGSRIAYCSLLRQEIAIVVPKTIPILEGDRLKLEFPTDSIHLFDPATGKRLEVVTETRERSRRSAVASFSPQLG